MTSRRALLNSARCYDDLDACCYDELAAAHYKLAHTVLMVGQSQKNLPSIQALLDGKFL